jgi:putative hydrolase of the HAD superfamily
MRSPSTCSGSSVADPAVDAVIFDWGGTLTPWHTVDFELEAAALAQAVTGGLTSTGDVAEAAEALRAAGDAVWARSRDHHTSATVADIFGEAGLAHDESLLSAYRDFWAPHTLTDPDVRPLFEALRSDGVRVGVLSNTVWPRAWHEEFFDRDGVLHLIDGAVYTSEIPWTKPAREAFLTAMEAVRVDDPRRCVFVGDRLFDDIWGAGNAGMRTVHVPHSDIPHTQHGHSVGEPDAVVQRLSDVYDVVSRWRS